MKIAQVAPLFESVPPRLYGGTERVVSCLTEELVRRGHEVSLFASGDSITSAKLVPCSPQALRLDPQVRDCLPHMMAQLGRVFERAAEYDVIHSHVDFFAFPFARFVSTPTVHTVHGRLDLPDLPGIYRRYPETNLISISDSQRAPLAHANWIATVHNGIAVENFTLREKPGDHLVFLGRISPEKGIDRAIEIAKRVGMRLRIAAKVDPADQEYYETVIKPLLKHPLIEYLGEINEKEKDEFLGAAYANLFPICWPEPFGLTMAESMACGTPVITTPFGSVPEIVVDGETGFICQTLDEMVDALKLVPVINRRRCREHVVRNFSPQAMADGYLAAYEKALALLGHRSRAQVQNRAAALTVVTTPLSDTVVHGPQIDSGLTYSQG
jgi:glycosyltransferase involved in cell wall biosynthesis